MKEYIKIGKSIINKFFIYYNENFLDDETEFFPILKTIINGIVEVSKDENKKIEKELKLYVKNIYCTEWLSHAKENKEKVDIDLEEKKALETFDEIYGEQ